ncbi:hypothetical protein ACO1O0_006124 [Amphichorda felina]
MFPPVDDSVLRNNPDFANLYNKLTNVILNPDGSTKDDPAAKERKRVKEELDKHRLKAAKEHLLTRAIATVSPPDQPSRTTTSGRIGQHPPRVQQKQQPNLPEPLLDLLLLLPLLLDPSAPPLPPDSTALLLSSPPLTDLDTLLPDLAALLSSHLRSSALNLARITNPTTNPSYLHRHIPSLAQAASALAQAESDAHHALAAARLRTLAALTGLLDTYAASLARLIRALEAKHGVAARSVDLRAAEVALQSQHAQAHVETALHATRAEIYTPEAIAVLKSYSLHLQDARGRTGERIKGMKADLAEYGVGVKGGASKERTMREMARVYREMGRQIDDARGDLERLQKG